MLKIYVLDLGSMRLDKNLIVNHSVQATSVEPNKQTEFIEIPIQAYLFETENKYVLFDTGVHPKQYGRIGPLDFGDTKRGPLFWNRGGFDTVSIKTTSV